jgi:DegV family protein with EDD domain
MKIGIVTDSTADLPLDFYATNENVAMVPLTVHFGDEVYKDWAEMSPDVFYERMVKSVEAGVLPKTSQPPAGDFAEVYKKLGETCDHIISIHISSKLSGTMQSAKGATAMVKDVPVTLIDSTVTACELGAIVKSLVEARDAGASLDEVIAVANHGVEWGKMYFAVDTLKYLEKGGRIGKAQALLGTLLNVKPLLTIEDGVVGPKGKASGTKKAIKEIIGFVAREAAKRPAGTPWTLLLAYTNNPDIIGRLTKEVEAAGLKYAKIETCQVGAVIGTYVGPGTFMVGIL